MRRLVLACSQRDHGELTYCSCGYSHHHHHHCLIWMLWMGFLDVSYHKVDTLFFFSFLLFSSLLFSSLFCFPLVNSFINQDIEERGEDPSTFTDNVQL